MIAVKKVFSGNPDHLKCLIYQVAIRHGSGVFDKNLGCFISRYPSTSRYSCYTIFHLPYAISINYSISVSLYPAF